MRFTSGLLRHDRDSCTEALLFAIMSTIKGKLMNGIFVYIKLVLDCIFHGMGPFNMLPHLYRARPEFPSVLFP